MTSIPKTLLWQVARMDDESFLKWASNIGYAPNTEWENTKQFRERVIDSLDRLAIEITRIDYRLT